MTYSSKRPFMVATIYLAAFVLGLGFLSLQSLVSVEASLPNRDVNPSGLNEVTIAVLAGGYESEEAAALAADQDFALGSIQGFYVAESRDFEVLGAYRVLEGLWMPVPCRQVAPGTDEACDRGIGTVPVLGEPRLERVPHGRASERSPTIDCLLDCDGDVIAPIMESMARLSGPVPLNEVMGDDWVLITAFRTKAGAESFLEVLRAVYDQRALDQLVVLQLRNTSGHRDIGLGQEAHPSGPGRLDGPLDNQEDYQ